MRTILFFTGIFCGGAAATATLVQDPVVWACLSACGLLSAGVSALLLVIWATAPLPRALGPATPITQETRA